MPPRTDPRRRPTGRREDLVIAAARLFQQRGYDATSMQDIASEMGILKGSLYSHVNTKEDLLWLIVKEPLSALLEEVRAIFSDRTLSAVDRIRGAIEIHCTSFERHHPHMFVITRENGETLSPDLRAEIVAMRDEYIALWKRSVTAGKRSGELRADLDTAVTVEAILGMINWMFRWFRPGGRLTALSVAAEFARLIEPGLLATTDPLPQLNQMQRADGRPAEDGRDGHASASPGGKKITDARPADQPPAAANS